jgi:hypothetical protein
MGRPRLLSTTIALVALGSAGSLVAGPRDPSGESASYTLDHDSARTSSEIESGTMTATVGAHTDGTDGPAYDVDVNYDFDIVFVGKESGTKTVGVPDEYFTPEFAARLRATGHYESPKFKIDYLGQENATTLDGHTYPGCDRIKIYDIKDTAPVRAIAAAMLRVPQLSSIENLVILGDIYQGVPVLGAVKLDVSGDYEGMHLIAGGDYVAP